MSVETARNIPKQIEDGIIAENPYFYVSNILELRHFNIDEIEVIKSRFLTPIQLKLISSLRKGTSLDIFCSPDDYHWNVTTARTNGETRQLFSIDKSHNVYAAPKYPEIPDFPKQLLSKIAEEKGLSGVQLQLEDRYQVSSEYLGKTLGIIVDHLKDHFEHLKDYYGLFTLFKKINFKDDSVMNNILKKDWSAVKNNFKLSSKVEFSQLEIDLLTQIASALCTQSAQIVANHYIKLWETAQKKQIEINFQMAENSKTQKLPGWQQKFDFEIYTKTKNRLKI